VADSGSYRVLQVKISTGVATAVAGSGVAGYWEGVGTSAQFQNVWGVTRDDNTLYVSDGNGLTDYIRAINLTTKETSLFATDFRMQALNYPAGLRVHGNDVYVANSGIGTIHRYNKTSPTDEADFIGSTRFGNVNGAKADVMLGRPAAFAITKDGLTMYAAVNNHIRKIILATGETSTIIGDIVDDYGEGSADQTSPRTRFSTISSLVLSPDETALYIADRWNNRIRKITLSVTPTASLISGAGMINTSGAFNNGYQDGIKCDSQSLAQAGCAYFRAPQGLVVSPDGATLYVADTGNQRIRSVRISDGQTALVAGSGALGATDGIGNGASFHDPTRLALSADGATLYVADQGNHRIRSITLATGQVTTLAGFRQGFAEGIGADASFSLPVGLALGPNNLLYISCVGSSQIMVINTKTRLVTLVTGSGARGYKDGTRGVAKFNSLASIGITPDGAALYIADSWNDIIRKVDLVGGPKFSLPAPVFTRFLVPKLKQPATLTSKAYLDIFGKNFRNGVVVTLGSYKVKTFVKKSTNTNIYIPIGKMKPGYYDLKITNRDTQTITKRGAFGVMDSKGKIPRVYYKAL
jgi:sugar lactone lactonase YvrE